MDIAKYIGLFLLKNKFCYIHGLGNLELKKRSASYDDQSLQPPSYEVTLTPGGSIDDNLANFIATNEQISISKASNSLREFSTAAKEELQAGREVNIPAIGKFVEQNGKLHFVTDPNLQYHPPSIPTLRSAPRRTETIPSAAHEAPVSKPQPAYQPPVTTTSSYTEPTQGARLNWGRIILAIILLGIVIAAVIFGLRYWRLQQEDNADTQNEITVDTMAQAIPAPVDTVKPEPVNEHEMVMQGDGSLAFKAILNTYDDGAKAERRIQQLQSYGNNVELITEDSTMFLVVMPVVAAPADTARILDSLTRNFNPSDGVTIY